MWMETYMEPKQAIYLLPRFLCMQFPWFMGAKTRSFKIRTTYHQIQIWDLNPWYINPLNLSYTRSHSLTPTSRHLNSSKFIFNRYINNNNNSSRSRNLNSLCNDLSSAEKNILDLLYFIMSFKTMKLLIMKSVKWNYELCWFDNIKFVRYPKLRIGNSSRKKWKRSELHGHSLKTNYVTVMNNKKSEIYLKHYSAL